MNLPFYLTATTRRRRDVGTRGVSTDVLIRVLAAPDHRAELRVKKTAA
jgi:hypothetical protein